MITNAVDTSSAGVLSTNASGNSPLDKNAFLKLLVTQLSNQDPLKPMDDTQFVSQLAQFSSLEQMQNMSTSMSSLLTNQTLTQSTSWIGKAVQWVDPETSNAMVGRVKSVTFDEGKAYLTVPMTVTVKDSDGKDTKQIVDYKVPMTMVDNIFDAEDTQSVSSALGWMGRAVTGADLDSGDTVVGKVAGVEFHNGITVLKVDTEDGTKRVPLGSVQSVG